MTFGNLKLLARAMIPGLKTDVLPDIATSLITGIDIILNLAVRDIASYTACLPTNKKFDATAAQGSVSSPYIISTAIGNYLTMGGGGLWWNQGTSTSPSWKKLNPKTVEYLDENRSNWHEVAAGTPEDYAIDGDNLYVVPAPVSSLSSGFWMFYSKTPSDMSTTTHYPFSGTTTELSHLSIFDMAIIYYARWKSMPMLGKDVIDNYGINQKLYHAEREEKFSLLKSNMDLAGQAVWQGPIVRP